MERSARLPASAGSSYGRGLGRSIWQRSPRKELTGLCRSQDRCKSGERGVPKLSVPVKFTGGAKSRMAELQNAAGKVAPNAEIDQALGQVRTSSTAP